jgi:hypothetical protein
MDVRRAADLYAQGRTLRQIGAELGVHWSTVGQQLHRAGVTMRRGGASAHPASTQQILELRDQGLTWPEIAEQVCLTVSGAWSRYRRARPPSSPQRARIGSPVLEPLNDLSTSRVVGVSTTGDRKTELKKCLSEPFDLSCS